MLHVLDGVWRLLNTKDDVASKPAVTPHPPHWASSIWGLLNSFHCVISANYGATKPQSRREGGERHCESQFHDPARLSEWWKSAFSAEHWAPSTRSPVDTSLFQIICGGNAPLRLSLDWSAARMIKRDFTQEAHLEIEKPGHVTLVTNWQLTDAAFSSDWVWEREGASSTKSTSLRSLRQWSHHKSLVKTQGNKSWCASGFADATQRSHQPAKTCKHIFLYLQFPYTLKKSTQEYQWSSRRTQIQFNSPLRWCHLLCTLDLGSAIWSSKENQIQKAALTPPLSQKQVDCVFRWTVDKCVLSFFLSFFRSSISLCSSAPWNLLAEYSQEKSHLLNKMKERMIETTKAEQEWLHATEMRCLIWGESRLWLYVMQRKQRNGIMSFWINSKCSQMRTRIKFTRVHFPIASPSSAHTRTHTMEIKSSIYSIGRSKAFFFVWNPFSKWVELEKWATESSWFCHFDKNRTPVRFQEITAIFVDQ